MPKVEIILRKGERRNYREKLLKFWSCFIIAISVIGGVWLKTYSDTLTPLILCSFILPLVICLTWVSQHNGTTKQLKWSLAGIPVCMVLTVSGVLMFWSIEPYVVSYPGKVSQVNETILKMPFSRSTHIYQVSVGSQTVNNKLQEIYTLILGAGRADRRYLSDSQAQLRKEVLDYTSQEASIKPVIAALSYLGKRPNYTEESRIIMEQDANKLFHDGDILISIDQHQIRSSDELKNVLFNPDHKLTFQIKRDGVPLTFMIGTQEFVHLANETSLRISSQIRIKDPLPIQSVQVSSMLGDSNGLPKAVEIVHQSSSDLIRNRTIVATGSVQADGTITAVGGLNYKLISLANVDFDICFIPEANKREVESYISSGLVPTLSGKIVYVSSLFEVISSLRNT